MGACSGDQTCGVHLRGASWVSASLFGEVALKSESWLCMSRQAPAERRRPSAPDLAAVWRGQGNLKSWYCAPLVALICQGAAPGPER